ncbi:hypothetical protein LPB03_12485 [Polaribacter vadi]|uniref:Uncharacterized protein n=1 Tax=Polaribacter vadi TaxID=1774273 RepID=A0A1B8TTT8_9FLAO|nr:hypothetical protein [Polaribacter vadi]AOW18215.1 hypothetical protein LPB03_12485 [Polaribacter vadi]OBY62948.1 hypothetical protein LPB3_12500 [Polaribacter vadi]
MKTIQKTIAILAISGFLFISCDKTKKEKVEDKMEEIEESMEDAGDDISDEFKKIQLKLEDGTYVNYSSNNSGDLSFDDWEGFNTANEELRAIEELDSKTYTTRIGDLSATIANLGNSIPAWLKTEEVMEDIEDIQKEYKKLSDERNESEDKIEQNIEDLMEKFDDLREELNETIEKYKS